MIEEVLSAKSWRDLSLPKTKESLRALQFNLHPDRCADSRSDEAFAKVMALFEGPDYVRRVATGQNLGGKIKWTMRPGFEDIDTSWIKLNVEDKIKIFFALPDNMITTYEGSWWFFEDCHIDSMSAAWIARRFAAAIHVLDGQGIVHGNINAQTVVLDVRVHGLKLDGWWHSVPKGSRLVLRPDFYAPPQYLGGLPADSKLDIAQAAHLLTTTSSDKELMDVFKKHAVNPGTPLQFLSEVDRTIQKLYGYQWHEMKIPTTQHI